MDSQELLIGAHTSAAGGAFRALLAGQVIGATTIQLFTSNQKRWFGKRLTEPEIAVWEKTRATTGIRCPMSHDSYLINLGSCQQELLRKSQQAFCQELIRCQQLQIPFLNFHPGAAVGALVENCLDQVIASIKGVADQANCGQTRLLIETTAGQGTTVGHRFEQIAYLISNLKDVLPIGACLDTCHVFASGYDIRDRQGWEKTLGQFDRIIGLQHLYAIHVNDSMKPLGARLDRHAPLGQGAIGMESFRIMMRHPALRHLPKYLETPLGPDGWREEIALLRQFAAEPLLESLA